MKKSDIVVGNKQFIDYGYVGGREDVNPDLYKVRTSSILCSLVQWIQVGYLCIYIEFTTELPKMIHPDMVANIPGIELESDFLTPSIPTPDK